MGRCYEMTIFVQGQNDDRIEEIIDAVSDLGYEADGDSRRGMFQFYTEVINIAAWDTKQSLAREIVEAIWEANGAFCEVDVELRDLEAGVPSYSWDEVSFDEWRQNKNGE